MKRGGNRGGALVIRKTKDQIKILHLEISLSKCKELQPEFCNHGNTATTSNTSKRERAEAFGIPAAQRD
jgi:hypothetical protein